MKPASDYTILIVDDQIPNLNVLSELLRSHGFKVLAARDGEVALEIAQRALPELILLDVILPGMNGFEVCSRLKAEKLTEKIPVMFMTILEKIEDKVQGFQVGATDYITKPFQAEEVLARVTTQLRLQNLTRELQEANETLEQRVEERTVQLARVNKDLEIEVIERRSAEEALSQTNKALDRVNRAYRTLSECNRIVAHATEETEFLQEICQTIVVQRDYLRACIDLVEPHEAQSVRPVAQAYYEEKHLEKTPTIAFDSEQRQVLSGRVIQTGKPVIYKDILSNSDLISLRAEAHREGYASAAAFPLLVGGQETLGAVTVYAAQADAFIEDEVRLMEELARDVAFGIIALRTDAERKQAEVNLKRYNQRLFILREIDRSILIAQSPRIIGNIVLERLVQLIPYDWASIMLYNAEMPQFQTIALHQAPNINFNLAMQNLGMESPTMGQFISGQSMLTKDMDVVEVPHTRLVEQLIAQGFHARLTVPLIAQQQLIGVLEMASLEEGFFTSEHQQIAEEVGAQIAIALHQADLHDQIARHNTELEQRVRERTLQLENANRDLELFSYSVSHDLRTPLRAIQGFAEIIVRRHRDSLNEEGRRYFDNIVTASEQMNQFITDLLAYARLGRQRIHLQVISLRRILSEILENFALQIEETQAHIQIADDLPDVQADNTLVRQIFTNLLQNALIYHQPDIPPKIQVMSESEADCVVIRIQDNGIGIQPEFHEKIFNIFQRLHSQDQYPGTGIGLAVVRRSVELLNGSIWIEPTTDVGSTFCVKFPKTSPIL